MTDASALPLPRAGWPAGAASGGAAVSGGRRIVELDGVRGLAALMVFLFHCAPSVSLLGLRSSYLVHSMWVGVDLFFVLSGFLITRVLLGLRDAPGRYYLFYARRTLRIFPLYYAALTLALFVLTLAPALRAEAALAAPAAWYYLYAYNIYVMAAGGWAASDYLDHFWSLAVEEQFYLVWPFLAFHLEGKRLLAGILAILGVALAAKALLAAAGAAWPVIYTSTATRMDAFALGGLAAYLEARPGGVRESGRKLARLAGVLAALLLAVGTFDRGFPIDSVAVHAAVTPLIDLLFALGILLIAATDEPLMGLRRLASSRWLRVLGTYSYGIYVYHWIVYVALIKLNVLGVASGRPLLDFALTAAATLLAALASFHVLEAPLLKLKDRVARSVPA